MLKHVYHSPSSSGSSIRGASPAPSSSSVCTDTSCTSASSSASSSSSPKSIYSCASEDSPPPSASATSSTNSSFSSWRKLSECGRTSSRLSMSDNPNAVPLRVYAAELRPDIQYKTVGVTNSTTCEEVISALLAKCKVRFKDPRLFQLAMEVDIRGPNGCDTRATIQLEDSAVPLTLQECYPKGQARFCLQMKRGSLVKVFDGSSTAGWQYKSIMISDQTTAGELVDILFRYAVKNLFDTKYYTLHIEVDAWKRQLDWDEPVIPAQNIATQWGTPKLLLGCQNSSLPTSLLLGSSTSSLYENVTAYRRDGSLNSSGASNASSPVSIRRGRWRRSKSLTESPIESISTFRDPGQYHTVSSTSALIQRSKVHRLPRPPSTLADSVIAGFAKLNTRAGKYELSEAFFV